MSVQVWLVDRSRLAGPVQALAVLHPMHGKVVGQWATIMEVHKPAKGTWTGYLREWVGSRRKIGATVFLTELAAERALQGEADRLLKTSSNYVRQYQPFLLERAARIPHPDIYRKKR